MSACGYCNIHELTLSYRKRKVTWDDILYLETRFDELEKRMDEISKERTGTARELHLAFSGTEHGNSERVDESGYISSGGYDMEMEDDECDDGDAGPSRTRDMSEGARLHMWFSETSDLLIDIIVAEVSSEHQHDNNILGEFEVIVIMIL